MTERRPGFSFIDLFAGIGGTRIAFENAGGLCVFSSESDRFARETYSHRFGEDPAGDIREIPPQRIPDHDVLVAGFPCQPFSIAGVSKKNSLGRPHGFQDQTQGTLFFQIKEILKAKKPAAFLLENVRNLKSHDGGRTFEVITSTLDKLGYQTFDRVLDGQVLVPQHRERVFITGFHRDLEIDDFEWPRIEGRKPRLRDILEKGSVDAKYTLSDHLWGYLQEYARKHKRAGNGFGYGLNDPDSDRPTRTLSARYHKDGSEILIAQAGRNPRRLTPAECARLMGFPDDFSPPVSDTQAYRQFGNSVIVPLVEEIAKAMAGCLNGRLTARQLQLIPA